MADSAALLVDGILAHQPMRPWLVSVSFPLRFLFTALAVLCNLIVFVICKLTKDLFSFQFGNVHTLNFYIQLAEETTPHLAVDCHQ
jgi:hypothetical protein